jgi:hypothetical protein
LCLLLLLLPGRLVDCCCLPLLRLLLLLVAVSWSHCEDAETGTSFMQCFEALKAVMSAHMQLGH